jgi:hypothetical protein
LLPNLQNQQNWGTNLIDKRLIVLECATLVETIPTADNAPASILIVFSFISRFKLMAEAVKKS